MAQGPLKKPLDFGGNLDRIMLGLGSQLGLGWGTTLLRMGVYVLTWACLIVKFYNIS